MTTRATEGGFEDRFRVTRTDGKPVRPEARYLVLDYANDPYAKMAVATYAGCIHSDNPKLADDLFDALLNPENWPSQHD